MINEVQERVKVKNITLDVAENVKTQLTRDGYNPLFGARPLRRLVTKYIEDLVSESLLADMGKKDRTISIFLDSNNRIIWKDQ